MNRLPKVLFVDDDIKILEMFEEFFSYCKSPKIDCLTCSDPNSVAKIVQNNNIDVIFLDFHFNSPNKNEMNGLDVLNSLTVLQIKTPKIILLTGVADIPVAVDAIRSGASDVLIKPIDLEKIKSIVIETYLSSKDENGLNNENLGQLFLNENDQKESKSNKIFFNVNDAIYVNSLHKLDDIFKYLSNKIIDTESEELYVFGGINHKIEGQTTIFYKGSKSLSEESIDEVLVDVTGKPRYSDTKFINYSPINNKKNNDKLIKVIDYKDNNLFFCIYALKFCERNYETAISLFSSSVNRVLNIEKDIKIMLEKIVEGSVVDFSNIMYKEV